MACGSKKLSGLPVVRKPRPPRQTVDPPKVGDFHCGECGLTLKKRRETFTHQCRPTDQRPDYQQQRAIACEGCEQSVDGVCLEYKRLHPDRDCGIAVGIKTSYAACPQGKWHRVMIRCPRCESKVFDENGPQECRYCGWSASKPMGIMKPMLGSKPSGVGFIAISYTKSGGVETWHQTLLPSLSNVSGFVAFQESAATGNFDQLGCRFGVGRKTARWLAESSEVLVVWGLGGQLASVLKGITNRPRVISVSHSDSRSDWTMKTMAGQEPLTDQAVYLSLSGYATIPERLRDDSVMIQNGVDPRRIQPTKDRQQIRSELGVSADDKLLLSLSRLAPEKNVHLLVDAAKKLPAEYKLVIVGDRLDEDSSYLQSIRNSSCDRITIVPSTDRPGDYLLAADRLLSASSFEGFGLSIAEAMLAGVPVIATPVGFVEHNQSLATIVPIGSDSSEWVRQIIDSFSHESFVSKQSNFSRSFVAKHHTAEKFVESWASVIGQHLAASQ